ncbi:VanZ family protein [Micrococcus endophyticus]|uniref:VanZ family protein n=1 Tax=Micrococcus endophyticus TaxID=455343 RepID=UPI0034CE7D2D
MPALASPSAPSSRRRRRALAALLAVVVVVHLVVLYLPGNDVPQTGFEVPGLDKTIHVLAFAAPTWAAVRLGSSWWWALPFAVHAPVSEAVQHAWVPLRTGDAWDMVADLAGVVLGAALAWRAVRREVEAPGEVGEAGEAGRGDRIGGSGRPGV